MKNDFKVINHGTVWQFFPLTKRAKMKIKNFDLQSWQMLGESFAVDWRPAENLVNILKDEGFVI